MIRKKTERLKAKKHNHLVIFMIIFITLVFLIALMRIGVGDAEWAGMTVSNLTPTLAMEYSVPADEEGVLVNWVEDEAYYSDVKEGDLVKAINGARVKNISEFLKVALNVSLDDGALLDILRDRKPLFVTITNKRHGLHGQIKEFLNVHAGNADVPANGNQANRQQPMTQVALTAPLPDISGHLPTPKEQKAAKKILVEGHWLGMELIPLVPELAKEYGILPNTKGLLVDEVSLEAAESGLLAGDMVLAVEGVSTEDLIAFTKATRRVKNRSKAKMLVSRRGQLVRITLSSERTLGFSQNEAAQPIKPGAISPHRMRSKPCTSCHIIMRTGGQLPTDAGDILPNPPPIRKGAVAPHQYRGKCKNCHVILK